MKFLNFYKYFIATTFILTVVQSASIKAETSISNQILEGMKDKDPDTLFKTYLLVYKKQYTFESLEGQLKFKTFKKNLENIEKFNNKYSVQGIKFGFNPYMDITQEEYFGSNQPPKYEASQYSRKIQQQEFQPIDWTKSIPFSKRPGWGQDGYSHMCYQLLFSYEAANFIASGKYVPLSAPQAMNCLNVVSPYVYINDKGFLSEADYPTPSKWWTIKGTCKDSVNGIRYKIPANVYTNLEGHPESPLISRAASDLYSFLKRGPVRVSVSASWDLFTNYKGGIFVSDQPCDSCNKCYGSFEGLLVGYGKDESTNKEFWLVKFHRGSDWGENSHMRIARNDSAMNYNMHCYYSQPSA